MVPHWGGPAAALRSLQALANLLAGWDHTLPYVVSDYVTMDTCDAQGEPRPQQQQQQQGQPNPAPTLDACLSCPWGVHNVSQAFHQPAGTGVRR